MKQTLKSMAIGLLATTADLLSLWLLTAVGVSARVANVPTLLFGAAIQFFGNKYLAFEDRSPKLLEQGARFTLVEIGALVLNALLFHLVVSFSTFPIGLARVLIGGGIYLLFSLPLWRCLVFSPARPRGGTT